MRTIKFEEKRIVVKGEDMTEVFTLYKSTDLEGNTQYMNYGGRTFYLTQVIHTI